MRNSGISEKNYLSTKMKIKSPVGFKTNNSRRSPRKRERERERK